MSEENGQLREERDIERREEIPVGSGEGDKIVLQSTRLAHKEEIASIAGARHAPKSWTAECILAAFIPDITKLLLTESEGRQEISRIITTFSRNDNIERI